MADLIRGKVAQIISERSLAINRGSEHGVTIGMRFNVLGAPAEITDPETKEQLGSIERTKVRVQVTQLAAKFAICETYTDAFPLGAASPLFDMFGGNKPATLKTKDASYVAPLSPEESYVAIGDDVRQVVVSPPAQPPKTTGK